VGKIKLSVRAEAELLDIYAQSEAHFGRYQADAYLAGLERTFALLADFPRIGQSANELVARYRRFRFQAHVVFYSEEDDHIIIRAIVYGARDIRAALKFIQSLERPVRPMAGRFY
jgi:toxin ParE1/3/4